MEGERVTFLDLDIDPSEPAYGVNNMINTDVVNLETFEPCMPMSVPYSYGACCLNPLDVDTSHGASVLTDCIDKLPHSAAIREVDFSSTRALSPCLADTRLDEKYDLDNMSPYDLRGETAQSLYKAATAAEYDEGFKVEYASDYTLEVPEYKQAVTPTKNNMWQCYEMSDSDDSWLPGHDDKENAASPHRSFRKVRKTPKAKKVLTPKSSYIPKAGSRLFSAEDRLDLAKYAAVHGVDEAVDYFSKTWGRSVSKKVAVTALEKYKMCKRSGRQEPTVEMMQATNKFTQLDRVQMAESCKKIGPTKTAKIFSEKLGMVISESTVRGFAKKY